MATAAVQKPTASYDRIDEGSHRLRTAAFPDYPTSSPPPKADAPQIATKWVEAFNAALLNNAEAVGRLFLQDSCWRDQLGLSWDYHTLSGPDKIVSFLKNSPRRIRLKSLTIDESTDLRKPQIAPVDFKGEVSGIVSFLTVDTDVGRGRGLVRLLQDAQDGSKWKVFTLFTAMHELKGHEEKVFGNRPHGVEHGGQPGRKNWQERRTAMENFEDGNEPTVLILGAGQGGLTSAARLHQLDIPTLIIDRNERVGDNWRQRYHQLVLHDPVWYDHLPYIPFPPHWPVFTPKDKLGEWFESYARHLELNVWTSTNLTSATWSPTSQHWTVNLERKLPSGKTESRTLHPHHIIQATGHSGEPKMPLIPGMDTFKGLLCHSSQFPGAKPNSHGKRAIVVGCCNSGHDIAQDYYENGYTTTIIQRSSTHVMSSTNGLAVHLRGLYEEGGPPTEDADLLFMSQPNPMLKRLHIDATAEIARRDKDLIQGLERAGFKWDAGPDGAGLTMKYFQRGGGYYIDVGASRLIVEGKVKVKQGREIVEVKEHRLLLAGGEELEADEVVFATGYENMRGTARRVFGGEVADRVGDVWGFDEEGELRTMWRRTGHPGFWFFGGNLALCRYYSRMLALQIKALEVGVMEYEDP